MADFASTLLGDGPNRQEQVDDMPIQPVVGMYGRDPYYGGQIVEGDHYPSDIRPSDSSVGMDALRREVYSDMLNLCAASSWSAVQASKAAFIRSQENTRHTHVPQQVVIHNTVQVDNKGNKDKQKKQHNKSFIEGIMESKFNKLMIFGCVCLSGYMVVMYVKHRHHVTQMQKKIDSSILLRGSQALSTVLSQAETSHSRWF
eukprot:GHVR01174779.1.p1 GENE.GHVR01174779.1~~GHVR01174779.1.p1  ORF type:complete len:201 (-),score=49.68 GHVR01174779.1:77-679(-)